MLQNSVSIVNYHHICDEPSCFDDLLDVRMPTSLFEDHLAFYDKHYAVVGMDQLLSGDMPANALIITFDDGYSSVLDDALPLLQKFNFPATAFVIGDTVLNKRLPIDNLMNYCVNRFGLQAVKDVLGLSHFPEDNLGDFIYLGLSKIASGEYSRIRQELCAKFELDEQSLFDSAHLFLLPEDLVALQQNDIEVGNHSMRHGFCRHLNSGACESELADVKLRLDKLLPKPIRSFAYPYGTSVDDTKSTRDALRKSGHQALFLVENRSNRFRENLDVWYRVSADNLTVDQLHRRLRYQTIVRDTKQLLKRVAGPMRRLRAV